VTVPFGRYAVCCTVYICVFFVNGYQLVGLTMPDTGIFLSKKKCKFLTYCSVYIHNKFLGGRY